MSQLFTSGGQSIRASASTSVLPMNTQDWSPLGGTGWISLQSKGPSRVFSNTNSSKASILLHSTFFIVQLSHPYMTTGKTHLVVPSLAKAHQIHPVKSHTWRLWVKIHIDCAKYHSHIPRLKGETLSFLWTSFQINDTYFPQVLENNFFLVSLAPIQSHVLLLTDLWCSRVAKGWGVVQRYIAQILVSLGKEN